MDYGSLVRDAWRLTWRYRFLWVLGLLAGGAVGLPSMNGFGGSSGFRQTPRSNVDPRLTEASTAVSQWAQSNWEILVAAAVAFVGIVLVLVVLSLIAQGGMTVATASLAEGRAMSLGDAWRAGQHFFWRYVRLWLILAAAAIVLGALVAAVAGSAVLGWRLAGEPFALAAVLAAVIGVPTFLVLIVLALAASIVVAYAQRIIALEDVGPLQAIRGGIAILRAHVGESLLVWLVNLGLGLGAGIAIGILGFIVLALLGSIGAVVWFVSGLGAALFSYAAVAFLVLLGCVLLLAAISNTFFWSYWTLAYLRLTGRASAAAITG